MNPKNEEKGEKVLDDKKGKETNKDSMNNALGDKRKDDSKLHTDYMRKKWKHIDTSAESTLRTPITSLSKTRTERKRATKRSIKMETFRYKRHEWDE